MTELRVHGRWRETRTEPQRRSARRTLDVLAPVRSLNAATAPYAATPTRSASALLYLALFAGIAGFSNGLLTTIRDSREVGGGAHSGSGRPGGGLSACGERGKPPARGSPARGRPRRSAARRRPRRRRWHLDHPGSGSPRPRSARGREGKWRALAEKKSLSIRQLIIEVNARAGFVGTPSQVAEQINEYVQADAADGYIFIPLSHRTASTTSSTWSFPSCRNAACSAPTTPARHSATTSTFAAPGAWCVWRWSLRSRSAGRTPSRGCGRHASATHVSSRSSSSRRPPTVPAPG